MIDQIDHLFVFITDVQGVVMGHIHLGRLPKTQRWAAVIAMLGATTLSPSAVADSTMTAAGSRLQRLRTDPSLTYCVWLLARLVSASRRPDFDEALTDLGLSLLSQRSLVGFIASI